MGHVFFTPVFQKIQPEYRQIFPWFGYFFSSGTVHQPVFFLCGAVRPSCFPNVCMLLPVCLSLCARVRARAKYNVGLFSSIFVFVKKCLPATCYFLVVYKNIQKFPQKIVAQELQNRKKCVPLQPLSRGRAAVNDRLVKRGRLSKALHPSILPCKDAREREKDKP